MAFLRRFFGRGPAARAAGQRPASEPVDLVSKPLASAELIQLPPPPPLGIQLDSTITPWAINRLAGIFRETDRKPTEQKLREARFARHCLSSFWLHAPIDQLENLYSGSIGQIYGLLLEGVLPSQPLAEDEQIWRDTLQQRLFEDFNRPERFNLLLAVMPYFRPGGMKVENPIALLPRWLLLDYARFCDPALEQQLRQPVGLLEQRAPQAPAPKLPVIAEYRGAEALELMDRDEFRRRMMGLLNLYRFNQQDAEINSELSRLRRQLGQLWLDLMPDQIEQLYRSATGELYRQLLASPFTASPLSEEELAIRSLLAPRVSDLSQEGALNVLLAVLPFFPPGKVDLEGGIEFIPPWLLEEVNRRQQAAAQR